MRPPAPFILDVASQWMLREDVDFLNHGSFGAVPREVYDAQDQWRRRIEGEPIELMGRRWAELLGEAKPPVAEFLKMTQEDFGFVTNATEGVNAVLHSLTLAPADELVTTNHVYNAVRQAMRRTADRSGVTMREIEVPTPIESPDQIIERVMNEMSDRTRLLVIDHVTSPTAIVFPVERIARLCAERGIDVLVDGAHAPGMIEFDVPNIGATYYAGNLHKWVCAPKGCAFLWVRKDRQEQIHPAVISHNLGKGLPKEFEWQGTRDLSAWLAPGDAIEFMGKLGWDHIRQHNHDLATWAHQILCECWGVQPLTPLDGSMLGAMATVTLPGKLAEMTEAQAQEMQQSLYDRDRIEVPLIPWQSRWHLRVSCQVYNRAEQYERLAEVIEQRTKDEG